METLLRRIKGMVAQWIVKYTGFDDFTGSFTINFNKGIPGATFVKNRVVEGFKS